MSINIFGSSGRQSSKMDKSGGNFTGDIHMADKNITISHTPMSAHDVANKKYVDTAVNNHILLAVTSDSKLSSSHVPTEDNDVINKKYLDAALAHRLNDDDMKIIENRLSLKANKAG